MDEHNICDWSKLDGIIAAIAKSFAGTSSVFGTFDFDEVAGSSQATQKERRVRRKADTTAMKRPISVTESEAAASGNGSSKVEVIFNTIKEVNKSKSLKNLIVRKDSTCLCASRYIKRMVDSRSHTLS